MQHSTKLYNYASYILLINNLNFSFVTSKKSTGTVSKKATGELNITLKNKALGMEVNKRYIIINQKFSSYLAGLFEGDGCIWIPINERDKTNKIIYPMIVS